MDTTKTTGTRQKTKSESRMTSTRQPDTQPVSKTPVQASQARLGRGIQSESSRAGLNSLQILTTDARGFVFQWPFLPHSRPWRQRRLGAVGVVHYAWNMRRDVEQALQIMQGNAPAALEKAIESLQDTVFSFSMRLRLSS